MKDGNVRQKDKILSRKLSKTYVSKYNIPFGKLSNTDAGDVWVGVDVRMYKLR